MANITIPTKGTTATLTNVEFNQILEALKDGTRDINTNSITANNINSTGITEIDGSVSINGESGPFAKFYELDNIIYVAKGGGTYDGVNYDGSSPGKALSSFQDAIDNAATILGVTPTEDNGVSVVCLDGAFYEEHIVCEDHIEIYAPNAVLKLGNGSLHQLIIKDNKVEFNKIIRETGTNTAVVATSISPAESQLKVNIFTDSGSGKSISNISTGWFCIDINFLELFGGNIGISDADNTSNDPHIHFSVRALKLGSSNCVGVEKTNAAGAMHGYCHSISHGDLGGTNTTAFRVDGGELSISADQIRATNIYNISGGELNLYYNKAEGAVISTGGITKYLSPAKLDQVDNTSDADKPISDATQIALNNKTDLGHTHPYEPEDPAIQTHITNTTGNPHMLDKVDVGLDQVDNTSDLNKPISTDTQDALDLKSNITHGHTQLDSLEIGNIGTGDYVDFDASGRKRYYGDATVYDDLFSSLIGEGLFSTAGTADYDWDDDVISFSPGGAITKSTDRVGCNLQLKHRTKFPSIFNIHMHWVQTDATAREMTLRWRIQRNGQQRSNIWNNVIVDTNVDSTFSYSTGELNQITSLVKIDLTGYNISDIIQFQFTRSDAVAGELLMISLDGHYEIDADGSDLEYTKYAI